MSNPLLRSAFVATMSAICLGVAAGQGNDECGGAQMIAPNTYTAGNSTAATTGFPSACNSGKDLWFKFTAPYSGTAELSTCSFLGGSANFDTVIAIWAWDPGWQCTANGPHGGNVACNDDYCGTQSYLSHPISYGATYYVSVGGFVGASGSFVLALLTSPSTPSNDGCASAIPMNFIWPATGETFGASAGGDPVGSCGAMGKDVWYTFTAPSCGSYTLTSCGGSDFDTVIAVWQGTCGALTQIACNDDSCASAGYGLNSTVTIPGVAGTTYYVSIGGGRVGELHPLAFGIRARTIVPRVRPRRGRNGRLLRLERPRVRTRVHGAHADRGSVSDGVVLRHRHRDRGPALAVVARIPVRGRARRLVHDDDRGPLPRRSVRLDALWRHGRGPVARIDDRRRLRAGDDDGAVTP